jgi:hypothetical protein
MSADALPAPGGWTAAVPAKAETPETLPVEIGKCRVIADRDTDEALLRTVIKRTIIFRQT